MPIDDAARDPSGCLRGFLGVTTAISPIRVNSSALRGGSVGKLSRIAWLYIGAVVTVAAIAVAQGPFSGIQWSQVAVLLADQARLREFSSVALDSQAASSRPSTAT